MSAIPRRRRTLPIKMDPDIFLTHLMNAHYGLVFRDFREENGVAHARMHLVAMPNMCREIMRSVRDPMRTHRYGLHANAPFSMSEAVMDYGERIREYIITVKGTRRMSVAELKLAIVNWWDDWVTEIVEEGFLEYNGSPMETFIHFLKLE